MAELAFDASPISFEVLVAPLMKLDGSMSVTIYQGPSIYLGKLQKPHCDRSLQ